MSSPGDVRVDVQGLRIVLAGGSADVVDDVSFQVRSGELLGLVGESGSGKTTVALALLGHVRRGLEVAAGTVLVGGHRHGEGVGTATPALARRRGGLHPAGPGVGAQPGAPGRDPAERGAAGPPPGGGGQAPRRPEGEAAADSRGGRPRQCPPACSRPTPTSCRAASSNGSALAMAFALRPSVIVLDEPTTGLDVTTQRHRARHRAQSLRRLRRGGRLHLPRPRRRRQPRQHA